MREIEAESETNKKDPSDLQYITPIDYAKRIAELDEDLRDAAEILVSDCSCYTPFRAFLMDVVQSDFAFMPNKLDLIRDIALGADNAERKAYSNNKYGLVEYSIRSAYVKISYKNRNGERKEGSLDWREIYEILSYMVKQPFYCGEDQKKYYQETKQETVDGFEKFGFSFKGPQEIFEFARLYQEMSNHTRKIANRGMTPADDA